MNIDKKSITLTEDTYAYIYRASEQEIFETFRNTLKKYINIINDLVNQDLKKLSDEQFYDLLCKVYSISLTDEDYLKILSKRNNKEYNRFTEIGTFMTFTDTASEGHGRDFSWWKQLYQVRYIIAISEDAEIEYDSVLRKKDIKKMVDDKSIVIVERKARPINNKLNINETIENIPSIKLNCSYSNGTYGRMSGSIYKDDNFPIVISMLRRKFTEKRILKDMKSYVEELQDEMEIVLSQSQHGYPYSEISKLCNEWYEKSEEKEKLKSLQRKINDK